MKPRHKRLALIGGIVGSVAVAVGLVLNAFQSNLVFFYSPSQVVAREAPASRTWRLGGLVQEGSIKRDGIEVLPPEAAEALERAQKANPKIYSPALPIGR